MRKILISGASRGIGKAIALKLLKEGHSLSLGVRKKEDLINTCLDPRLNNPESFLVYLIDNGMDSLQTHWVLKNWYLLCGKCLGSHLGPSNKD